MGMPWSTLRSSSGAGFFGAYRPGERQVRGFQPALFIVIGDGAAPLRPTGHLAPGTQALQFLAGGLHGTIAPPLRRIDAGPQAALRRQHRLTAQKRRVIRVLVCGNIGLPPLRIPFRRKSARARRRLTGRNDQISWTN